MKHLRLGSIILLAGGLATARAGLENCQSGGGPTVCVKFDNLPDQPAAGTDVVFNFSNPQAPNIILQRGANTAGTMYEWRVWSKDSFGTTTNIGSITSPGAYNYSVKIFNASGQPGATSVGSINLSPAGDHYSNVADGNIQSLAGGLTVKPTSAGAGGQVSLTVNGALTGTVSIYEVKNLSAQSSTASMDIERLTGAITIGGFNEGGVINIVQTIYNAQTPPQVVLINQVGGKLEIMEVVNDPVAEGDDFQIRALSGILPTGELHFHDMGAATVLIEGLSLAVGFSEIEGKIKFWEGIGDGSQVTLWGKVTGEGEIDLNNEGIGIGASLKLEGGGDGQVVNGGQIDGTLKLGGLDCETPEDCFYFTGDATFTAASSTAEITVNTGAANPPIVKFTGTFDGNICGTIDGVSWPNSEPIEVPGNIHLAAISSQGKVCGTAVCGSSLFTADPSPFNKTRFISFSTDDSRTRAIGIRLASLHRVSPPYNDGPSIPFTAFEDKMVYVGPPSGYIESNAIPTPFKASYTQCSPDYRDWSTVGLLHVTGSAIVPSSEYEVEMMVGDNAACAAILPVATTRWGDVAEAYNPPATTAQPDIADMTSMVNKFRSMIGAPIKARAVIAGNDVFGVVNIAALTSDFNFSHISACIDAFRGKEYPFKMGACATGGGACTDASECTGANAPPCNLYCP